MTSEIEAKVAEVLKDSGLTPAAIRMVAHDTGTAFENILSAARDKDRDRYIEAADVEYGGDEVNIDGNAVLSHNDEGAWVSAWVFVSHEMAGIEESDDDE